MLHYQNKVAKWTTLFYVAYQQFNLTEPKENIINLEEYNEKLASYQHKLDLSDEIIRINEQYNLGIIDEEERDLKIDNLLKK